MNFKIICDFSEDIAEKYNGHESSHDHPPLKGVLPIIEGIKKLGFDCEIFGGVDDLVKAYIGNIRLDKNSIYLNLSDGLIQNYRRLQAPVLCELLEINYSGSTPFAVSLMNNKHFTKLAVKEYGIKVPRGILLSSLTDIENRFLQIDYFPVIIKPNGEGSSVGIRQKNVVYDMFTLKTNAKEMLKEFKEIIIEEYIAGIDITTFLLGHGNNILLNQSLAYKTAGAFRQEYRVLDGQTKSKGLSTNHALTSVTNNPMIIRSIEKQSKLIFKELGCRDIARIDYRLTDTDELVFIEINSLPRFSPTSEAGSLCRIIGIDYEKFISLYLESVISHCETEVTNN